MAEIIPEIHTLGSIDPHTLFVDLNGATRREIEDARAGGGAPRGWEIYEHEARHWRDLISTVWGRNYLNLLFRTYDAILTTPERRMETTFAQVLELFDRDRSILFPSYYKYVLPEARVQPSGGRWSMSFSTGVKIASDGVLDERQPFIFVRFDEGPTHLARQPLSEGSLLEGRALAAEDAATKAWLGMRPRGEDFVTWRLKEKEQRAQFYNPELTTYSVAPHVVAYATGITETRANLNLVHKLADVALNLDDASFARLRPTRDMGTPPRDRLRGFRRGASRGYAFCCLAFAMRDAVPVAGTGRDAIEMAMKTAGLPTVTQTYSDAAAAVTCRPGRAAADPRLAAVRTKLIAAGAALHRMPDFDADVADLCPAGADPAPLVGDADCDVFSFGAAPLDQADSEYLHDCHELYREVLRSALRAARGLEFAFSDFVY